MSRLGARKVDGPTDTGVNELILTLANKEKDWIRFQRLFFRSLLEWRAASVVGLERLRDSAATLTRRTRLEKAAEVVAALRPCLWAWWR